MLKLCKISHNIVISIDLCIVVGQMPNHALVIALVIVDLELLQTHVIRQSLEKFILFT